MKHVIIGASATGISAAETLRRLDENCEIVMISEDKYIYSRCMLHHYISHHRTLEELSFVDKDFFEKNRVNWIKGKSAKSINPDKKVVLLEDGEEVTYDKLLIATGARATIPPIENLREGTNVHTLRDLKDILSLDELAGKYKNAVVIGAGLVGLDAISALVERNVNVSVMEMSDRILPLQLDKEAANVYEEELKKRNVSIFTNVKVVSTTLGDDNKVISVNLEDGRQIPCDFVVVAAGVRANTEFLEGSGVKVERGIVIDENLRTNIANIYAAGDVCGTGIWPIAVKQGRYAAYNMVGKEEKKFNDYFQFKNTLNFFGIKTVSIGDINDNNEEVDVDIYRNKNLYKKIVHKDGIVKGVLFQGNIDYCGVWTQIIKNKIDISSIDNKSIFDINYGDFFKIDEKGKFSYNNK